MTLEYFIYIKNMEITANRGHKQRTTGSRQETRSNKSRIFTKNTFDYLYICSTRRNLKNYYNEESRITKLI